METHRPLNTHGICWSIPVRLHKYMKAAIATVAEDDWIDIEDTAGGLAQVAETIYTTGKAKHARSVRLVVRRTRLTDKAQRRFWPDWRHHAFITNRADLNTVQADQFHREHATVELVIRDLKEGAGLEHLPSGNHHANAAWLACAVLAHNIGIWTTTIAELPSVKHRTRRTRIIALSAVIVNHAGTMRLRFPTQNGHGPPNSTPCSTAFALCQHHQADQPIRGRRDPPPTERRQSEPQTASFNAPQPNPNHQPQPRQTHPTQNQAATDQIGAFRLNAPDYWLGNAMSSGGLSICAQRT